MIHDVRLDLSPGSNRVEVNGTDITDSVSALQVCAEAGEPTRVQLDIPAVSRFRLSGDAIVRLPGATREALIALDWTPPENER